MNKVNFEYVLGHGFKNTGYQPNRLLCYDVGGGVIHIVKLCKSNNELNAVRQRDETETDCVIISGPNISLTLPASPPEGWNEDAGKAKRPGFTELVLAHSNGRLPHRDEKGQLSRAWCI